MGLGCEVLVLSVKRRARILGEDGSRQATKQMMKSVENELMDLVARGRQLTETVEWVDSERIKRNDLYKHLEKPSGAGVQRGKDDCDRNANVRKGIVGVMGNCLSAELVSDTQSLVADTQSLVADTQSLVARCHVRCGYCEILVYPEFHVF